MTEDLQTLPLFRDSWSILYVERARIEQEDHAITIVDERGRISVPIAQLATIMLGPGTTVTHAAMMTMAASGCSVVWCGEEGVRFYASGVGLTRSAANLMEQAARWADPTRHHEVVMRLYRMRFSEAPPADATLQQVRGLEGVRVRESYAQASMASGVAWHGRSYDRGSWSSADPVNRALSAANACLYGVCHAAIVAAGFSPGLGFIHTGKALAFVYDVADLYKCQTTVPAAFEAARLADSGRGSPEGLVRRLAREAFRRVRLLERVVPDIQRALGLIPQEVTVQVHAQDDEPAVALWDAESHQVPGGVDYSPAEPDADEERP